MSQARVTPAKLIIFFCYPKLALKISSSSDYYKTFQLFWYSLDQFYEPALLSSILLCYDEVL